jgi:hypothetical protein
LPLTFEALQKREEEDERKKGASVHPRGILELVVQVHIHVE